MLVKLFGLFSTVFGEGRLDRASLSEGSGYDDDNYRVRCLPEDFESNPLPPQSDPVP